MKQTRSKIIIEDYRNNFIYKKMKQILIFNLIE